MGVLTDFFMTVTDFALKKVSNKSSQTKSSVQSIPLDSTPIQITDLSLLGHLGNQVLFHKPLRSSNEIHFNASQVPTVSQPRQIEIGSALKTHLKWLVDQFLFKAEFAELTINPTSPAFLPMFEQVKLRTRMTPSKPALRPAPAQPASTLLDGLQHIYSNHASPLIFQMQEHFQKAFSRDILSHEPSISVGSLLKNR